MTDELLNKLHNDLTNLLDTLDAMIAARAVDSGACSAPTGKDSSPSAIQTTIQISPADCEGAENMDVRRMLTWGMVLKPITTMQDPRVPEGTYLFYPRTSNET